MIDKSDIKQWLERKGYYASDDNEMNIEMIEQCFNDLSDQWVSVSDRLPNAGEIVLVGWKGDHSVGVARYTPNDKFSEWSLYHGVGEFTHWMKKPEPPK